MGKGVVVTFRARNTDPDVGFFVSGDDTRGWNGEPLVTRGVGIAGGRRSFRVVLPARPGLKFVTVRSAFDYGPRSTATTRVR